MNAAPPAELTRQEKVFTMLGVLLGMLLAALDQTIVATAGPAIQRDLAMPASLYAWITTAYMVSSTVLVPIYGKLSDLYGRKPILLVGITIFLLGSFLCGVSQTPTQLVAARAVQGVGAASLFTTAFAVVADIFPAAVRGRYTGIFGAVWAVSSVVGPFVGGLLTDTLGWHWVFFVNLPIGAVAIAFVVAKMPRLRRTEGRPRVDVLGAAALALGVVPLLLALSLGNAGASRERGAPADTAAADLVAMTSGGYPWASWQVLGLFAVAAFGLATFILVERRVKDPILDLKLFRNQVFAWGNAASFVIGAAFFSGIVFLPLFMVNVVGLSATRSGVTLTPLTLGLVAGNVLSGQVVSRIGRYRRLMLGALALLMVAFVVLALSLDAGATQAGVTWRMVLVGLGLGPSIPLYTLAIQNGVEPRQIGVATASATFFRQMGATIGVAVLGTVFANQLASALDTLPPKEAFAGATRAVFWVALAIVALGTAITARIPEVPLRKTNG